MYKYENYRIGIDNYNHTLYEVKLDENGHIKTDENGKEQLKIIGYYTTLSNAFKGIIRNVYMAKGVIPQDLTELHKQWADIVADIDNKLEKIGAN